MAVRFKGLFIRAGLIFFIGFYQLGCDNGVTGVEPGMSPVDVEDPPVRGAEIESSCDSSQNRFDYGTCLVHFYSGQFSQTLEKLETLGDSILIAQESASSKSELSQAHRDEAFNLFQSFNEVLLISLQATHIFDSQDPYPECSAAREDYFNQIDSSSEALTYSQATEFLNKYETSSGSTLSDEEVLTDVLVGPLPLALHNIEQLFPVLSTCFQEKASLSLSDFGSKSRL